jgi:hypothetical protein
LTGPGGDLSNTVSILLERPRFLVSSTTNTSCSNSEENVINHLHGFLDDNELDFFRQTIFRAGIASSATALTEKRALRRLNERAHAEDLKKESIAAYLLHPEEILEHISG